MFCFAAIDVLFELAAANNWGSLEFRAPIFALVPWAYASKPKSRLVIALSAISFICIGGAFLTVALPPSSVDLHPSVLNVLGAAGFVTLGAALATQVWLMFWGWRADRARLRANSRGPLERTSGGF